MTEKFEFPLLPIERPCCFKCGTRTMLARMSPHSDGLEKRVFECPKCDETQVIIATAEPMEAASGWVAGELKPPI
jgi:hypothetical protein